MHGKVVKGAVEPRGKSSRLVTGRPMFVSWTTSLMSDNVALINLH